MSRGSRQLLSTECNGTGEGRSARYGLQGLPAKSAALLVVPAVSGCYRLQVSLRRLSTLQH